MASQYFAILTNYGTRAFAQALSQGQPLQLTQFAVGDGNGQAVTPTASATALVHQTHIAPVSAVSLDPRNNKQVIVELTIPENIGGFYIREMGVFDAQNKLIAYANCPESFKPTESSGSGKVQVLRMILKVESSSAVTLSIDHSVIFVTRQQMTPKAITATTQNGFDESGHTHEIAKASTSQQGITQLSSATNSNSETQAATSKAVKTAYDKAVDAKTSVDRLQLNVSQNYIPNNKKSSAVNSRSSDTVATSAAAKTAYDKAVDAKTSVDRLQLNVSQNYIPNNKKSSAVNSSSSDTVATSAAVKTAYDKAVDAKTTAERKVGLRGNESIQGTKSFESKIIGFRGIGLADSQTYANANHLLNMGANDGDGWIEYKKSNRAIGTIRIRANGELSYNNQKIYHAAAKPQFNTDIEGKPNTLAGYGIGNFKIEEFRGNLNTLKTDGIYAIRQASLTQNLPVSTSCHIQVIAGGNGTWCRQLAYVAYSTDMYERHQTSSQRDSWSAWKKLNTDGVPIGAVVSFPRAVTNPVGFLRADGSTFSQQTFPDLYRTLGNHNQLPDLTRSDVGMTAYFAVDNIPAGWIAFDEIATQVTEQRYPELHRHLVGKYGSINSVPKVADRFLRNAGNGLSVGQTQEDELKRHTHKVFSSEPSHRSASIEGLKNDNNLLDAGLVTAIGDNEWRDNGWMTPDVNSNFATGGDETRPKSLILKLCIKALNSFDDVVFWIKSHGEVTNAGALDAGRLAQGLQNKADRNHTHTVSQITDFNQATSQIINAAITYQRIGNVEIRKYPDGTMIQTGRIVFTRGNTAVHTDLVLPIAYIDKEYRCFITERYESRASGKGQYNWVFMQPKTNTTATITNWYLGSADWMTIGRWKR
ncbi:phage tail protein [Haemophilus influenzae]|uniref:phage tail-collar fiber domain-containing protein n=2 Tax=Haemophilus influenzae TaxID=727 RepID=UPI003D7F2868